MTVSDEALAEGARRAARAGGTYLRETFRTGPITAEYGPDDVRAAVDREAERRVVAVIREAFPEHAIYAEESGQVCEATGPDDCQWFVDPLDGTNNFASGLATFATAVAVRRAGTTRAAAIYEPIPDDLYLARRDGGATVDGEPLSAASDVALEHGTVSLIVGPAAIRDRALRVESQRLESTLRGTCKRVLQTWSPCVDWGLLARGGIEGLVAFHPPSYERHAGELLAAESGAVATTLSGADDTARRNSDDTTPSDSDDTARSDSDDTARSDTDDTARSDTDDTAPSDDAGALSVAAGDESVLADLLDALGAP